jgi:hypothetical protein
MERPSQGVIDSHGVVVAFSVATSQMPAEEKAMILILRPENRRDMFVAE